MDEWSIMNFMVDRQTPVPGAAVDSAGGCLLRFWQLFEGSSSERSSERSGVPQDHDQEVKRWLRHAAGGDENQGSGLLEYSLYDVSV